jgi:outer membrane protein OmpA-like peptidoglycan-associated protein
MAMRAGPRSSCAQRACTRRASFRTDTQPAASPDSGLFALQHAAGNRAMSRFLRFDGLQRQPSDTAADQTGAGADAGAPADKPLTCEKSRAPADLGCREGRNASGVGTNIGFDKDSTILTDDQRGTLSSIAAAWHTGGEVSVLRVDGFASCDGPAAHNWRLSCNRAKAVAAELQNPSDKSPGVPKTHLEIVANGETDLFGSLLARANRCVVVSSNGAPPPGPPCALTIAGPATVDHFCKAYVPSDSPTCGVFPAPPITLNATGGSAASTLTWSIARGGKQASIVGKNTGTSVQIQGDARSAAKDDVTVQVTDGSCTSTHTLTVREPSAMTATQNPSKPPGRVRMRLVYTVRDQFGDPMGAGICIDETVTVCADNHPEMGGFSFGDAATNANGQLQDTLESPLPDTPPPLCIKVDQVVTAGGCGPVMHNTIVTQPSGFTVTPNSSCTAGGACP